MEELKEHLKMENCQKIYSKELKKNIFQSFITEKGTYRANQFTRLKKEYKDICSIIIKETEHLSANSISERVYCILHDITEIPKCNCGENVSFEMFSRGYRQYCSVNCSAKSKDR